jgi:hypothetical protein
MVEDLAETEKKDEEKVVSGPKEMLPGNHMCTPVQGPSSVLNLQLEHLGVETEETCVLEMVDRRDAGAKVPLPRQDFVDVSLPHDSSLPQVGSATVSLPRHVFELDSVSLPLPR